MENVNSEHAEEKTKTKKKWITPKTFPYILVFPAVFLFAVFTVYPVISSFILSFQASEGGEMSFIGLQNYIRLFNDGLFYQSLINTFTILIIQVPIMITLAILLAVMLNSALIRFNGFFRVSFFLPSVTALVTASIVFIILLDSNYGIVNYVLSTIGLEKVSWLNDPFWAKVSIMLVVTWRWTGYNMVILLAGLQNVSKDLYESASIDGAGKVRQFFYITLPQLKPVILFTVVLSTIGTLQLFDEPYILTNGGPNNSTLTVIMYLYDQGFRYFDFGYASAIAYVLVIIIAVLSWIQLRVGSDRD
ncbi:carbohydrate ABC transporter permease [Marinococcus halophilus]|uniref:carbohydrate ABC transporter permease n=1 Tax=Marinococcus halophilus TaxID=1371 RepID=UPI0009A6E12B|nr:sugar ABC transporter permease [Marinococcus halophilus]